MERFIEGKRLRVTHFVLSVHRRLDLCVTSPVGYETSVCEKSVKKENIEKFIDSSVKRKEKKI